MIIPVFAGGVIGARYVEPDYFESRVFPIILKYEGSKYINDSKDPGGPTKYGITLRTAQKNLCKTKECLKNLPLWKAKNFYRNHFWVRYGSDKILNRNLAVNVLLAQINLGPYRPSRLLQKMTNDFCHSKLVVDGRLGAASVRAINKCPYDWPGFPYILYYFYKDNPKIKPVWKWAHRGLRRRIFHGVDYD